MTTRKPSTEEIRQTDHAIPPDEKNNVDLLSIVERRKRALDELVALSEECGGYPELD